jgi:hypothetical protein
MYKLEPTYRAAVKQYIASCSNRKYIGGKLRAGASKLTSDRIDSLITIAIRDPRISYRDLIVLQRVRTIHEKSTGWWWGWQI